MFSLLKSAPWMKPTAVSNPILSGIFQGKKDQRQLVSVISTYLSGVSASRYGGRNLLPHFRFLLTPTIRLSRLHTAKPIVLIHGDVADDDLNVRERVAE